MNYENVVLGKQNSAVVASLHDERRAVGFAGYLRHLYLHPLSDRTGRILVQYSSFSGSFRTRNRVTPFNVFKKRRGLQIATLKSPSIRDSTTILLSLSTDYDRVTILR